MMTALDQAQHLRPYIEKAMQSLPDAEALQARTLYPLWDDLVKLGKVDTNGDPGYRFLYEGDGELYKCVNGDPTFQSDWIPGMGTGALYVRIDAVHAGTLEDPIPADRGMEYIYGKYYQDPEDGKMYKCHRAGEADGGTIVLQHLPHELVGHYFVEA